VMVESRAAHLAQPGEAESVDSATSSPGASGADDDGERVKLARPKKKAKKKASRNGDELF
jgi:hypothetical protein